MPERALKRLLILGGTSEARALADGLSGFADIQLITSIAGRTRSPQLPRHGAVRVGGFGGAAALVGYLRETRIDLVIDATHPYAAQITENAVAACSARPCAYLRLQRPPWVQQPGDRWINVDDHQAAAARLSSLGRRAFLTIGQNELQAYRECADMWFLIRAIERPAGLDLLPAHEWLSARGPFLPDAERALLQTQRIDMVVSKNSGGAATYAKIAAAREGGLPVVMIARPALPDCECVADIESAIAWVRRA